MTCPERKSDLNKIFLESGLKKICHLYSFLSTNFLKKEECNTASFSFYHNSIYQELQFQSFLKKIGLEKSSQHSAWKFKFSHIFYFSSFLTTDNKKAITESSCEFDLGYFPAIFIQKVLIASL